jgi:glycosyltransferase involved in cell wall biosynthesis
VSRSVLLVAQLTPPSNLVAARRVAGMTKYLRQLGHSVTVLTSLVSGSGPIDGAERVVRTRDALLSRVNWRRRHFSALAGSQGETAYKPPSRLASVVVPDLGLVTWLPFAFPRALALTRRHRFDCVVTTSPPQSAHLVGLALHRRGLPWIAEFRDGWTFEPPRDPWPLRSQRELDGRLERVVVKHADAVVGVTTPIAADFEARLDVDAELITNGFDPDEALRDSHPRDPMLAPDRYSFVHTGRMGLARVTPRPLLEALRVLKQEEPRVCERLEVVFAGSLTEEERDLLAAPDLDGTVRAIGWIERPRALRLQRAADSLLLLTEGSSRRSVATGKLYEYLLAGCPVLVLGEETEAARIVAETGTGIATSAVDPRAIAEALRDLVEREWVHDADENAIGQYSWTSLANRYAELIERVSAGHDQTD